MIILGVMVAFLLTCIVIKRGIIDYYKSVIGK